jgi:hypothetical protein
MAVSLKHKFTSSKTDVGDTSLVRPSNWNDEHDLTIATGKLVGRTTADAGTIEEITPGSGLTFSSGSLSVDFTGYLTSATAASTYSPISTTVTLTGTQTLTNKTLTEPVLEGTIVEDVFTITDGASVDIDPSNGSIQLWTLTDSRTPVLPTSWTAGQGITLQIDDGSAYAVTWTTMGVVWAGGTAPTLATTGYTVVELWKVGTTIYGALVGDVA